MKLSLQRIKWIQILYFIISISLVIYSFTQVDLNLTLSAEPIYQTIQQKLTHIGYFNRPLSATLFLLLFISLFGLYFLVIILVRLKMLNSSHIWKLVGVTFILAASYPAFSHDLFNYMFDARVVTKYGLDPRYFKALDFPLDPWTRFMHWTHRYYPYGPGWLFITLVPAWLGMSKFVVTLIFFKVMFLFFHLVNIRLIQKILEIKSSPHAVLGLTFFALNPLVLIESIVSPHNEAVMLTFVLLGFYLLVKQKYTWSTILLMASISIKYISFILMPLLFIGKKLSFEKTFRWAVYLWFIALIPLFVKREPYSWYLVPVIGLGALIYDSLAVRILITGLSAGLLIRYLPYLLFGDYGVKTIFIQQTSFVITLIIFSLLSFIVWTGKSLKSS